MMGLALFWIMQFHLSWVVLVPYVAVSFYYQFKTKRRTALAAMTWFAVGAVITGSFLAPTFMKFGLAAGMGSTNDAVEFNYENLVKNLNLVEGVLGRFLSFATFELPRFVGANTAARVTFMKESPWLIPFIALLTLTGILQCIAMLVLWFKKTHSQPDWRAMRYFTLASIVLLYVSFLFSMKSPVSHTFYVMFPVAMLYSLYCWSEFLRKKAWQRFAAVFLACGIIFHVGLAISNFKHVSIYRERAKVVEAIKQKDFRLLGERRDGSRY
jgi:hypothetical protein